MTASERFCVLASERAGQSWIEVEEAARLRLDVVPEALDDFGMRAFWDEASRSILATGALEGSLPIVQFSLGEAPTDLVLGHDGVLYMAVGGRIRMHDLRHRWPPTEPEAETLEEKNFRAWRLAAAPGGGVWALDREGKRLAKVEGLPLRERPFAEYSPGTFRPCVENPDPPRLHVLTKAAWPADEEAVAISASPQGTLSLLSWVKDENPRLRMLADNGAFGPATSLKEIRFPFSLAWAGEDLVAVLLAGDKIFADASEAPVYRISEKEGGARDVATASAALPVGDVYPLRGHSGGPFLHSPRLPAHYPTREGDAPLHHLSLPSFAAEGEASNRTLFDSGSADTEWHRLYLEAAIPPHCGVRVYLAASDVASAPDAEEAWHEHRFGEAFAHVEADGVPRGAWVKHPSEIPFHEGLLACPSVTNQNGLFTALIQRAGRRVRTLRGRYLWMRVLLSGDGRTTPEVAALRAYASRFSYLNHYLPELYRETEFGPDANSFAPATRSDFLERFLDNFESILTPLEDRIGHAYLLTDPRTAPEEALAWLGSWIGVAFDTALPASRRRKLLEVAPRLYSMRGTLDGLRLALDVATGGAVTSGEIVIVEDFRLRRTFATILGADLEDEEDPLLGGLVASGNSYVGDTLFVGDENRKEFLALFSPDIRLTREEEKSVETFFERLAHRVTVLVHTEVVEQDLGLIRRIVQLETPAHVEARVSQASAPFMVGAASLVSVDTYLSDKPGPRVVEVGRSRLGTGDRVQGAASLDPRLGGSIPELVEQILEKPVADPGPDRVVRKGESFELDASYSRAPLGRTLVSYQWKRIDK